MTDVEAVGGKNASLGEMISQLPDGVRVPTGFATTAHAFREFLAHAGLADRIQQRLATLDTEDVRALAAAGAEIRGWIERKPFPPTWSRRSAPASRSFAKAIRRPASRCAPRPPPRTCRMHRSPASRRPSSTWSASTTCCTRCARCSPRSTTTARSATACTRASPTPAWRCRRACSAWSAPTSARPASCSPSTPSLASTRWSSSPQASALARRWCRAP
jgi:hypothetical protein